MPDSFDDFCNLCLLPLKNFSLHRGLKQKIFMVFHALIGKTLLSCNIMSIVLLFCNILIHDCFSFLLLFLYFKTN